MSFEEYTTELSLLLSQLESQPDDDHEVTYSVERGDDELASLPRGVRRYTVIEVSAPGPSGWSQRR